MYIYFLFQEKKRHGFFCFAFVKGCISFIFAYCMTDFEPANAPEILRGIYKGTKIFLGKHKRSEVDLALCYMQLLIYFLCTSSPRY